MKKRMLFVCFCLVLTGARAQMSLKEALSGKVKVIFLGLDFMNAKYIGPEAFPEPGVVKHGHVKSWNSLLVLEPNKFSLQGPLKIADAANYETRIDDMVRINADVDVEANIANEPRLLNEAEIGRIVSGYKLAPASGVGIVYIAENLDKRAEAFSVWVTFIDLASGKMIHTERITGKPKGFGLRNYWAGGVYSINKAIGSVYYKKWTGS